jgi:hypothetical protein
MEMQSKDFGQCFIKFDPTTTHYNLYHMFQPLGFAIHIDECKTAIEANQTYWKHINIYRQSAALYDEKQRKILQDAQDAETRFLNEGNPNTDIKKLLPPKAGNENDEDWGI